MWSHTVHPFGSIGRRNLLVCEQLVGYGHIELLSRVEEGEEGRKEEEQGSERLGSSLICGSSLIRGLAGNTHLTE